MDRSIPEGEGKRIKSAERVFEILEVIGAKQPVSLSELTDELDVSKSTLHYYLKTPMANRFVVEENQKYRFGLRCLEFGGTALSQRDFPEGIEDEVDNLAEETGQTAVLVIEEMGKAVCVYKSPLLESDSNWYIGVESHLHVTAFGKAILAHLPEEDVFNIIEHYGLPQLTEYTVTDTNELIAELEEVRQQGLAYSDKERQENVQTLAAPIIPEKSQGNETFGTIGIVSNTDEESLSKPTHLKAQRFKEEPSNIVNRFAQIIGNKIEVT
ncbi:IclR family transcriptional regulator [Haloplanus halobius]|uniref:IclR family transcriptional regulator n=1 Tax=Haloplanus halobius TaxID=2934938 RepID=UPI00200E3BB0|nr:IclR family transcriptional regulator [Haloplanus sp. XH21]